MQCYLAAKGEMWAKVGPHLLLFALLRSSRGYCVAVVGLLRSSSCMTGVIIILFVSNTLSNRVYVVIIAVLIGLVGLLFLVILLGSLFA